jgi:hypothetical protein
MTECRKEGKDITWMALVVQCPNFQNLDDWRRTSKDTVADENSRCSDPILNAFGQEFKGQYLRKLVPFYTQQVA